MGYTTIDINKLNEWLDSMGKSNYEIALALGRGPSFFSHVRSAGRMQEAMYSLLCKYYDLPQDALTPDPTTETAQAPTAPQIAAAPTTSRTGYWTDTQVFPDRVKFTLYFDEEEVCHAYAKAKGNTQIDLVQAISYAAHMCYKIIEQKTLEER